MTYKIYVSKTRKHHNSTRHESKLARPSSTLIFLHLSPLNNLPNLIIGGSLFLLTYLTLTPLTGAITHTDIQNLTPILKKIKILWPLLKPLLTYETKLLSIQPSTHQHES